LTTVLAAAVVLGVVIFVHELGHFLAAKAVGVGVPRFSIGFGSPTPLRFRRGETEYVLSWIPLGGYVAC
jgi:regulator of sigma E protease